MASNVTFVYVSEEDVEGKTTQKTQQFTLPLGKFTLDNVNMEITKISSHYVTFEIDDFENDTQATFLVPKTFLKKSFTLKTKAFNLSIGTWLDFTDGKSKLRRSLYIKGIKNEK